MAIGTKRLEDYIPVVKYNEGVYTDLPIQTTSTLNVGGITSTVATVLTNGTLYPIVNPSGTPVAQAATATLVAADLNKNITNTGASGTIVLTLPAVAGLTGYTFHIEVTVAQIVRLLPVTGEAIALGGSAVVTKYLNIAAVIGNMVDVYCDGSRWLVVNRDGVITKEA